METSLSLYQKLHFLHRCYRYRFRTERHQIRRLWSLDLKGKTVFDVGGNHGIYAYWLGNAVGPAGSVHFFEPQPELCIEVKQVLDWLGLNQVIVNSLALSDVRSRLSLNRGYVGDGSASFVPRADLSLPADSLVCETTTVDDYCSSHQIDHVAFMKIDVEGHELSVVNGALQTLRHARPTVQIELRVHEPTCDQVISIFQDLGYTGFMFSDGREVALAEYKQVPHSRFGFVGHRDFLFEPRADVRAKVQDLKPS
jgi:FkbM family methyltransferase